MEALTEVFHSTKQIKVVGFSVMSTMDSDEVFQSRTWTVGGYVWEVQVLPNKRFRDGYDNLDCCIALNLYLRSEVPKTSNVKAKFSCRIIDPSGKLKPSQEMTETSKFTRSGESISYGLKLMSRGALMASGYLKEDAFAVECTITVLRELAGKAATRRPVNDLLPSSGGLHQHLGDLLAKGTGADVTFLVCGESFAAHNVILASRSPVFMAEFFGHMKEKLSQRIEIKDMEAAVFEAMLRFIYTDLAPAALDQPKDGLPLAQHLLVAAVGTGLTGSR